MKLIEFNTLQGFKALVGVDAVSHVEDQGTYRRANSESYVDVTNITMKDGSVIEVSEPYQYVSKKFQEQSC